MYVLRCNVLHQIIVTKTQKQKLARRRRQTPTMETVTPTTTAHTTKSVKRKLAEKLLAIAFLLFLLLLVFTFVGENNGENTFLSSFQKEHAKRHRERQQAINLAHHEDEEKTFHDILSGDEEKERETFIRAHDEAVKVHSDDDDDSL